VPYFDSRDGVRLHYQDWGTGQPALFLAGGWLSSSSWELQMHLDLHDALVSATLPFPTQTPDNPDGLPKVVADMVNAARAADRPLWMEQNAQAFFAPQTGNAVSSARIAWMVQQCLNCSLLASDEILESVLTTDFRAELRDIAVPTMIIHGDADASAPIDLCGRKTRELIPGNLDKEYPAAGHGIIITHAEQLNADIVGFIKS
jgi:non-heme chloroperoxidase